MPGRGGPNRLLFWSPLGWPAKIRARQRSCSQSADVSLHALAIGRHVEALLHFVSLEAALGDLGLSRRAALRTGDSAQLSAMHRVFAEAESKSGRSLRALPELDLASLGLKQSRDRLSEARLELVRGRPRQSRTYKGWPRPRSQSRRNRGAYGSRGYRATRGKQCGTSSSSSRTPPAGAHNTRAAAFD